MREQLEKELEKIGLSEKEAKVYLAALELGPSTAQTIAAKATVNRPTTYIMIETLIKRGLMSSFEKGKKRFFVAGSPQQLLYLIDNEKRLILEKEKLIVGIVDELTDLKKIVSEKTSVRFYEDTAGIRAMQEDILDTETDFLYELVPLENVRKFIPAISEKDLRQKIAAKFKVRSLYQANEDLIEKQYDKQKNLESRRLVLKDLPIKGEVIICGNKSVLSSYKNKPSYILIEDDHISTTLRSLFLYLWKVSE